jgi:hypothetical protein
MIKRITWGDLYPRALTADEPRPGIVKLHELHNSVAPCWRCGTPTKWASLYWEAHTCSFVCDDLAWHEYGRDVWGVGWDSGPVENQSYDYQTEWAEDGPIPEVGDESVYNPDDAAREQGRYFEEGP